MLPRLRLCRLVGLEIARVVPENPARQMQAECDDLGAVPPDLLQRARPQRRRADFLFEDVVAVLPVRAYRDQENGGASVSLRSR